MILFFIILDDGGGDNGGKDGRDYTCLLLYSYTTAQTNIGIPVFVIVMFLFIYIFSYVIFFPFRLFFLQPGNVQCAKPGHFSETL